MARHINPLHHELYTWALANLKNPETAEAIVHRFHEARPDLAKSTITLAHLIDAEHRSGGSRFPLFHRPAYGIYQITEHCRLDDAYPAGKPPANRLGRFANGETLRSIASAFEVAPETASTIVRGITWPSAPGPITRNRPGRRQKVTTHV